MHSPRKCQWRCWRLQVANYGIRHVLLWWQFVTKQKFAVGRCVYESGRCDIRENKKRRKFRHTNINLRFLEIDELKGKYFITLGASAKVRKATVSFVWSVRPSVIVSAWNISAPSGRIFIKCGIWTFFEKKTVEET